jgi:quercetin dioxygenase-like cupin family protein
MKIHLGLAVPLLLLTLSSGAAAQGARDAVALDPTHHNVLFENDHVRVFRALASPGAHSAMHTHPPFVFIGLGTGRLRLAPAGASPLIFDVLPEQVLWMENAEHSWEMLSGQLHVVAVEIKAAARGTPPTVITLPATDAVAVDPVVHQVILENEYVRVIEALAGSGYRSPMHTHEYGLAIVSLGRPRLRLTLADGNSMIVDLHPGQVMWLDAGAHSWEVLAGQHRVIAVEVKSATAAQ